ncbi:hypothetical protein [Deferribacter abyssi]|uniref:hypothetical protein n=1 Tax=Deferribacter abyssi TaxID=213806 RepID=UPI003C160762
MNKVFSLFVIIFLFAGIVFAGLDKEIHDYISACENKNIEIVKKLIDESSPQYNQIIMLHKVLFKSLDIKFLNYNVLENTKFGEFEVVKVKVKALIKSKVTNEAFISEKIDFFIFKTSNKKIVKIINDANFELIKKNAIYSFLIEEMLFDSESKNASDTANEPITDFTISLFKNGSYVEYFDKTDDELLFKIKYKGNKEKFMGYVIIERLNDKNSVRKLPLLILKNKEKIIKLKSMYKLFIPGDYVVKIVDFKFNLHGQKMFEVR